jgi:arylsulfatase A-like enzyme
MRRHPNERQRPIGASPKNGASYKALLGVVLLGCLVAASEVRADCTLTSTGKTALTDMAPGAFYKDPAFVGGLYPNLSNKAPDAHWQAALAAAQWIRPLSSTGAHDPTNGRIGIISVGVSNTSQEFAVPPKPNAAPPEPRLPIIDRAHTFLEREKVDPAKSARVVMTNGAQGGSDIEDWAHDLSDPTVPNPDPYGAWAQLDSRIAADGMTSQQVQVAWVKHSHSNPQNYALFPTSDGSDHIFFFQKELEQLARNLKYKYPNIKVIFVSSRTRAYKDLTVAGHGSREPFSYEHAFSVRRLIEQQIHYGAQPGSPLYYGNPDPAVNDGVAPVIVWGPYLWVDGMQTRSDGEQWRCNNIYPFQDTTFPYASAFLSDTRAWDGVGSYPGDYDYKHPGGGGIRKVASQLVAFFKTQPTTAPWFLDQTKVLPAANVTVASGGVTSGVAPLTVQFTATNVDPTNANPKIIQYAWDFDDGTEQVSDLWMWDVVNGGPPGGSFAVHEVPHDLTKQNPTKTFYIPGTYNVRMTATEVSGKTVTKVVTIQVSPGGPTAPTVSLVSPEFGEGLTGTTTLRASATDLDGSIAGVSFYVDGVLVGAGTPGGNGAYTYVWSNPPTGSHDVLAIATDNSGSTATSFPATVTVTAPPPNLPPAVAITSPFSGTSYSSPATITVDATATDPDGSIGSVTFLANGAAIGAGTLVAGSTYRLVWTNAPQGAQSLTAVATDNLGLSTTSAPVDVTVFPPAANTPPNVALTSPVAGASYTSPAAVALAATATDVGGSIAQVAFYVDGVFVGTGVDSGSSLYTLAWLNGSVGSYQVQAIATDDGGLTGTSSTASISIGAAPSQLRCTSATEGTTFRTSVRQFISCNQFKLQTGPSTVCTLTPPPACAGTKVADATALAHGPNNPPAASVISTAGGVKKQYDCQAEIAKSIYTYFGDKVNFLTQGNTPAQAEALVATAFNGLSTKCTAVAVAQDPSGVILPQVGPACASFAGSGVVGGAINIAGLTTCLHDTLDLWTKQFANYKVPLLSLLSPAANSSFTQPVNLSFSATASDLDGTISQVAFFSNGAQIGTGTLAGGFYGFTWASAPAGSHALTAVATDNDGLTTQTAPIAVTVNKLVVGQPPVVAITSPASGAAFTLPTAVTIDATATDDGSVSSVAFYADGVFLGNGAFVSGSTYRYTWLNPGAGTHQLTVVATDNSNMTATTPARTIYVRQAPSVVMASPASGTVLLAPASVPLVASATDADGTIATVQFYVDGVLVGSGTSGGGTLYNLTWLGTAAGSHAIHAVATDNDGVTATSPNISVVLQQAPTVAITSPANGAVFSSQGTITVDAIASDADGVVTELDFYVDGAPVGMGVDLGNSTFRFVWSGAAPGSHTIVAIATDDDALSTSSAPISITVQGAPTVAITSPSAGAVFTSPTTINLTASATESGGTIASVQFYADGVLVGTGSASGSTYTYAWGSAPAGTLSIIAVATDSSGVTAASAAVSITVVAPPTVAITSPSAGAVFTSPTTINLAASATDSDGTIASVEFYADGVLVGIGSASGSTYTYAWGSAPAGTLSIVAVATDSSGLTSASAAVGITVLAPPTVAITSPSAGAVFTSPATINLTASATDSDGTIANVQFFADGVLVGTGSASGSTYTYGWGSAPAGTLSIIAVATDSSGLTTASAAVSITVIAPPTVAIASPAAGAVLNAPSSINIDVTATDVDGAITNVDVRAGGALLGAAQHLSGATYRYVWSAPPAGVQSLTAVATDDQGLSTTSAAVAITVRAAPSVSITSPAQGASFGSGAPIALTATATDADGTVTGVQFFVDGVFVGAGAAGGGSTYTFTYAGAAAGAHSITAVATDNDGLTKTSSPVSIAVNAQNQPPVVAVTTPSPGASFTTPVAATLVATASDPEGALANVTFYVNGAAIGTGVSNGSGAYSVVWLSAPVGSYSITAVATDGAGQTATSAAVPVSVASPPAAPMQCTTAIEGSTFRTALSQALSCNQNKLQSGPGLVCNLTQPPACAGTFIADANALAFGPNNPPASAVNTSSGGVKKQVGCQSKIGQGVSGYAGNKMNQLMQGSTPAQAEAFALPYLDVIAQKCTNVVVVKDASNVVLPAVGPQCSSFVGGQGSLVDHVGLKTCLHDVLDGWIRKIGNYKSPSVAITAPAAGASFSTPLSLALSATASDLDGTIAGVSFYADGALLGAGTLSGGSYGLLWSQVPAGAHALTAVATDSDTLTTKSAAVPITVNAPVNQAPTVAVTSPAAGASFTSPASITLSASASDSDGTIASVAFYDSGVLVGAGQSQGGGTYSFTWTNAAVGSHSITATATDNGGLGATSSAVSLVVSAPVAQPPLVALTGPIGSSFTAPANVPITATASDLDGTVASVAFYANGVLLGTGVSQGASVYSYTWTGAPAGAHSLTAVATDDTGLAPTSSPLVVTVAAGAAAATCTTQVEAAGFEQSLLDALSCDQNVLALGPGTVCQQASAPPCSDTAVSDVRALVYGPNDPAIAAVDTSPAALGPQYDCQAAIAGAARLYAATKLDRLTAGDSPAQAEAAAAGAFDDLAAACDNMLVKTDASGVVLPQVGTQCAAAIGAPGGVVNASTLTTCLHTLLDVWTARIGPSPQPLRPNIVFIVTDDQRSDTTNGIHGLNGADAMARTRLELTGSGVEFTNAFTTTPLCAPSRASMLTGQYAFRHGVRRNAAPNGGATAFNDASTLATWLKAAGYRTGMMGKYTNEYYLLWANAATPYIPPGWDDWQVLRTTPAFYDYAFANNNTKVLYGSTPADYSTDVIREKAKSFITTSVAQNQPFFAFVSFIAPHNPATPAVRHAGAFSSLLPFRPPNYNEADVSDKPAWVQSFISITQGAASAHDTTIKNEMESMLAVDEAIGGSVTYGITGIMDTLRDAGVLDNTIVIYTSDHGLFWGEHRLNHTKFRVYEEDLRVPFLVRYPRLAPLPRQESRMTLNVDIAATLADLAGATPGLPQDGQSIVRVLDGTASSWRNDFLVEAWTSQVGQEWAGVREDGWKYSEIVTGEAELYDLQTDPYEMQNLASQPAHASRVSAMAARLRSIRSGWPADVP